MSDHFDPFDHDPGAGHIDPGHYLDHDPFTDGHDYPHGDDYVHGHHHGRDPGHDYGAGHELGDHLGHDHIHGHGLDAGIAHHALNGGLAHSGQGMVAFADFDPAHQQWDGAGNPAADMHYWHEQQAHDTCAIASQEFILDGLTGHQLTEHQLRDEAQAHGWYTPGGGTPMHDMGKLLEAHGLEVQREQGASIQDLSNALAHGEKVMVGVDHETLAAPNADSWNLHDYPGIPGQHADHAVEVIGIEQHGPNGPIVVLNDPGRADGRGEIVPLDQFEAAWRESGDLAVIAAAPHDGHPAGHATAPPWPHELSFGSYYNGDGTYHWVYDNTDKDLETGKTVRRY